jgi:hypothetical protein
MGKTFRPTLLAGALALAPGLPAVGTALAEEPSATAPRAMTSCFDLGWAIAEGFAAPRDCDGAWNYAILVGAIRICELEGNLAFADLIRGVKRQCDLYYASKPSTVTDNQDFYKE